jgi:diguanylate cyclase (GGDEF)-like protein
MKRYLTSNPARAVALAIALGAVLALAAHLFQRTAERLVAREAEQTALKYAKSKLGAVPSLDLLLDRGSMRDDTLQALRQLRSGSDVFRFKLFDHRGQQLLASDDLDRADPLAASAGQSLRDDNPALRANVLGGASQVELKAGNGQVNLPALYSEAYVPVMAGDRVRGIVAINVDQTERAARIHAAFVEVGTIVGTLLLLVVGAMAAQGWQRLAERRKVESRMRYLAEHDVLSGALNRASFNQALAQAAWRHEQGGAGFAVLCIDLDRFKDVNDSYGHAAGDEVLRQATQRLRSLIRHGDLVARLGGDEFAVLQSAVSSADDVGRLAQRVVDALAQPFDAAEKRVLCGASVGAARYGADAKSVEELLHKADVAMYRAKTDGRGRFSFYDEALDRQLEQRRTLATDLRSALSDGSMSLHYQPLYASTSQKLVGYEALMRWQHAERGLVPPAEFVPLAEETGQIEALGEWALRRACADAALWPAPLRVAVNLSAAQFRGEKDLVQVVRSALGAAGLAAERLEIEITESLLMGGTDAMVRALTALSALGVQIAMDDFGTGYSSLANLWRFPFDKLKIDRAFTQGLYNDKKVALIVRSIVSLAHSMGIRVTAEGVETTQQMAMLKRLGCDELQGYLLGHPAPAETLKHLNAVAEQAPVPLPPESALAALLTQPATL